MAILKDNIQVGNYEDKYSSKNLIAKFLVKTWLMTIKNLVKSKKNEINSITDLGCGEGFVTAEIDSLEIAPIKACDFSFEIIKKAKKNKNSKNIHYYSKSIYDTSNEEKADFILCLEVLEHLENPDLGLEKLQFLTNKYCLLSVPNEPLWRILNFLRGKYLKNFGNTPGHLNHWSRKTFYQFVSKYFEIIEIKMPIPWIIFLCKKK